MDGVEGWRNPLSSRSFRREFVLDLPGFIGIARNEAQCNSLKAQVLLRGGWRAAIGP
jgi:hypothetical protein